jgi:uncharacterized repeat protein (TIGR03847 family)
VTAYYEFEEVDAFTTGAIGRPGARTFYLQARVGKQRVAVKCEKQQVTAIVQYLRRVLNDLPPPEERPLAGALELALPVSELFVLGPIGLGYDRANDRLVVQLEELVEADVAGDDDDDDDDDDDLAGDEPVDPDASEPEPEPVERGHVRVYVSRSQAAAFCDRADEVVAAGRPTCQWCGNPIDPDGHPCPRMN